MDAIPGCFGLPSGIAAWRGLYEPAGGFCRWLRGFRPFGLGGRVQWPARFPHTETGVIVLDAHPPHHRPHTYPHTVQATAYSPCSSGSVTALGTHTHAGIVASNTLRLRTWIETRHPVNGRRRFRVEDTGSPIMRMDFWMASCSDATNFGRQTVRFRVLPHGLRSR